MDKYIHMYNAYGITYLGYSLLKSSSIEEKKALLYSGLIGLSFQIPKEIVDGFTELNGFSILDLLSEIAGSSLFVSQQLLLKEQIIRLKFSFSKSEYADPSNGYLGKNLVQYYFKDPNAHTYWISCNLNRLFLRDKLPPWLSMAAGYSVNGVYGAYQNETFFEGVEVPQTQRYRQFLLSLDIDWSRIRTKSGFLKTVFKGLNLVKIPFPAVEFNSLGKFKGYWLYF